MIDTPGRKHNLNINIKAQHMTFIHDIRIQIKIGRNLLANDSLYIIIHLFITSSEHLHLFSIYYTPANKFKCCDDVVM